MLFRKVFNCYIDSVVVLAIVLITITTLLLNSSVVVAQNRDVTFDKDVEEVPTKVMVDDKSDKMIGSASSIDRKATRVKLFDDIFSVCLLFIQFNISELTNEILNCSRYQSMC